MRLSHTALVGRLITITDYAHAAQDGANFWSESYCLDSTVFWFTDEDMDDPHAPLILCVLTGEMGPNTMYWQFEYDGEVYIGELWLGPFGKFAGGNKICGYEISFKLWHISLCLTGRVPALEGFRRGQENA